MSSSNIEECFGIIERQCRVLIEQKIPFIFSYKYEQNDTMLSFGTKNANELVEAKLDDFLEAFKKDLIENEMPKFTVKFSSYKKMKSPLSLANANEIRNYARYLIVKDYQERKHSSEGKQIKYGEPDWEATFWPNDLLIWTSISKNFSNIKQSDVSGDFSITSVLKKLIKNAL